MFNNYKSNSLKELASLFSDELSQANEKSILIPNWVVVQNKEAQQWLTLEVAKKTGIASNFEFILPSELMWKLYRLINPELPKVLPSDRISMHWQLFEIFESDYSTLRKSKSGKTLPTSKKGRFQFAEQVADVFDLYQVYRPELLTSWEQGRLPTGDESEIWQAKLWLSLVEGWKKSFNNVPHRGQALNHIMREVSSVNSEVSFPKQLYIFGVSQFSIPFLRLISAFAKKYEVHFFGLENEELASGFLLKRLENEWGKPQKELNLLLDSYLDSELKLNVKRSERKIHSKNLLNSLVKGSTVEESIKIHSCHSSKREAEVLKDEILKILDTNESSHPEDILIMVPDLEEYVSNFISVFKGNDLPNLPIQVYPTATDSLQLVFVEFLKILNSTFKVNTTLELLDYEIVRNRFEIDDEELRKLKKWLNNSSIHWGLDEEDSEYSLTKGVKSFMSGFAMELGEFEYLETFVPSSEIHTSEHVILSAKFSAFIYSIKKYKSLINTPKTSSEWIKFSISFIDDILKFNTNYVGGFPNTLQRLLGYSNLFESKVRVDFNFFIDWISNELTHQKATSSGLGKGIVLSTYIPYRGIPFKYVFILGMNEGVFPRTARRPSFDLINKYPKIGDRVIKEDDSALFLELLQNTTEYLHISYLGQDLYSDNEKLPSILVQQLLDTLNIESPIKHKLHGFDPSYFLNPSSYSGKRRQLAEIQSNSSIIKDVFFDNSINFLDKLDSNNVEVSNLTSFFMHPCKYMLTNYLGVYSQYEDALLKDREIFSVSDLGKYTLDQIIKNGISSSVEKDQIRSYSIAAGYTPQGLVGERGFESEYNDVESVLNLIQTFTKEKESTSELNLKINEVHLRGVIGQIFGKKRVFTKISKIKAKDFALNWILHVLLSHKGVIDESILIGKEKDGKPEIYVLNHVENPLQLVETFIEIFELGFSGKDHLTFFPETSKAFVESKFFKKSKDPQNEALKAWVGSEYRKGESSDLFNKLVWQSESPLSIETFSSKAEAFWIPFFNHFRSIKS